MHVIVILKILKHILADPGAAPSKAWLCDLSLARILGLNTAGGMDVCLLWLLCVVR